MDTVSIKLSQETRRVLRLIAAHTDRTIQEVAEDLVKQEWVKVQRKEQQADGATIRQKVISPN